MFKNVRQLWKRDLSQSEPNIITPSLNGATEAQTGIPFGDFAMDDYKPIKVIVIGAGMCGILAGIR